jgi:hypothetical protein
MIDAQASRTTSGIPTLGVAVYVDEVDHHCDDLRCEANTKPSTNPVGSAGISSMQWSDRTGGRRAVGGLAASPSTVQTGMRMPGLGRLIWRGRRLRMVTSCTRSATGRITVAAAAVSMTLPHAVTIFLVKGTTFVTIIVSKAGTSPPVQAATTLARTVAARISG